MNPDESLKLDAVREETRLLRVEVRELREAFEAQSAGVDRLADSNNTVVEEVRELIKKITEEPPKSELPMVIARLAEAVESSVAATQELARRILVATPAPVVGKA